MMPNGWVTIDAAADASRVDVRTIRQWAASGAMDIEFQGQKELVRLERVRFLCASWSFPSDKSSADRGSLRGLLGDSTVSSRSVTMLQQLARERVAG